MVKKRENPAAGHTGGGVGNGSRGADEVKGTSTLRTPAGLSISLANEIVTVSGRLAQTLQVLIQRGASGLSTDEAARLGWARRLSDYIAKLKKRGVPICKVWERTADGARIGRYLLCGPFSVVDGGAGEA